MKNLRQIDSYRDSSPAVIKHFGNAGDHTCGVFNLPCPKTAVVLRVLASAGEGWDHVSISLPSRCPNWLEMEHVKRSFFEAHETAMQLHVPTEKHISVHPNCLHIWRPQAQEIPLPPSWMVA